MLEVSQRRNNVSSFQGKTRKRVPVKSSHIRRRDSPTRFDRESTVKEIHRAEVKCLRRVFVTVMPSHSDEMIVRKTSVAVGSVTASTIIILQVESLPSSSLIVKIWVAPRTAAFFTSSFSELDHFLFVRSPRNFHSARRCSSDTVITRFRKIVRVWPDVHVAIYITWLNHVASQL